MSARSELELTIVIKAPASLILKAFFDADALGAWWRTARAVTTPRVFGAYAIEWPPTDFQDPIFGRLGGTFHGTVMQFDQARGFFVADVYWLPPDSDPVGPMALEVALKNTTLDGEPATRVRVSQSGFEASERWKCYYDLVRAGWERALQSLKSLLEK